MRARSHLHWCDDLTHQPTQAARAGGRFFHSSPSFVIAKVNNIVHTKLYDVISHIAN
jgi:hypothetical protein